MFALKQRVIWQNAVRHIRIKIPAKQKPFISKTVNYYLKSAPMVAYKIFEDKLRIGKINTLRITLMCTGLGGVLLYAFRDDMKGSISSEVADVASRSLDNVDVVLKAEELAKGIVWSILNDVETNQHAMTFLVELFKRPGIIDALSLLVNQVIAEPQILNQVSILLRRVVSQLSEDPATIASLTSLVGHVLQQPDTHARMVTLVCNVLHDPASHQQIVQLVSDVITSEWVQSDVLRLGLSTTHDLLANEHIQQRTAEFFRMTLADEALHATGADAIWSTLKQSVTPGFFRKRPTPPLIESTSIANKQETKSTAVVKVDLVVVADISVPIISDSAKLNVYRGVDTGVTTVPKTADIFIPDLADTIAPIIVPTIVNIMVPDL